MKRVLSWLVAMCVLFGAFACASAEAPEVFKIGMYQVMSGANAIYGEEAENAIKMVVAKMNAEGGLNGVPVEFVLYDDQGSPEEAVKAVTKLLEVDRIDACITSCISSCVLASAGALNEAGVPTFGTGLSPTYMAENWEYVFRACVNSGFVTPLTVDLAQKLGVTKVAIFRGQDESAIATANSFRTACDERGVEVLTEEAYTDGDNDFSGQISRIIRSKPEAVFISTVGATYGVFIKQLRQYGYEGLVLNKEALPTDAAEIAGDAANYVAFAAPYLTYSSIEDCTDSYMKAFLESYYAEFGVLPVTDSAYRAYDSMMVIWEAANKAGSNDHQAIKDAIGQISGLQGLGGTLDFTSGTREGLSKFNQFIRVDGMNVNVDSWIADGGLAAWQAK